jgi:hypothetical protein
MTEKPESYEMKKWAIVSAVGALISAAFAALSWQTSQNALGISQQALDAQQSQFEEVQAEKLDVALQPLAYDPVRITPISLGDEGKVVTTRWRLQFSNTGQQRLSITNYRLSEGKYAGAREYTGLDGGIFEANDKRIFPSENPIVLEPGDTKVFRLDVGQLTTNRVADTLALGADPTSGVVFHSTALLAKAGVDLYGNRVEIRNYASGSMLLRFDDLPKPTYWLEVFTGRSNKFVVSASPSPAGNFTTIDENDSRDGARGE